MPAKERIVLPALEAEVSHEAEVVVVGGGASGIAAAMAAARSGADTLLIEQRGFLGGMGTVSLVPAFCPFTDKEKPVVRGIGLELLQAMKRQGSGAYRRLNGEKLDWVPIDAEVLKRVYDEAVLGSGARLLLHTGVSRVLTDASGERIEGLVIHNKSGTSFVRCAQVIDATGDADIAALAGAPFQKGGEDGELQPGTMCYLLANANLNRFRAYLQESGDGWQIPKAVSQAQDRGDLPPGRREVSGFAWVTESVVGVNFGHIFGIDGTRAEDLTRGAVEGRRLAEVQLKFLQRCVPGFEEAHLVATGEQIGIRETRRIVGDYVLTQDDFMERRSFPDDIARNSYFIDIHMATSRSKMQVRHLPPGESHGVPYRSMLPLGLSNVWVPGRAASCDRVVQGSLRVMPNCFAMGQAAGTAAALAAEGGLDSRAVNTEALQRRLVADGAWLGEALLAKFGGPKG
ncbi:FAD-dependent oxidoreductase [Paenibacillus mucilaginosus]|uniref:FAD dependent oxidoreductase n=1 Tax=Paenibacillus mucilaginosus (strain KNP414) TaxID=1036673 RepID=F8FIM5_PAEMK|nr:FAD-dependent oxidoreductase [Paenibacillus mucilaginosus]AEI45479.1 FAD dependent oxidoreductase [Paenibacillus mucilaginosus KNP414]MCG7215237.1 FAD-dependent oxidoreductase [Paenibacillus mucilaginosus]WDM26905.1 FAD-dependent oxidoreductase [Paenibacillus mucilaginosus]